MSKETNLIVLNSTVLYVLAFLTSTIFHEFAHGFAGFLNSTDPIVHHNYVEHLSVSHLSIQQQVAIALAGPVLSLIQGLVAGGIFLNSEKRGLKNLFLLWLSVLGFNNYLGYLMTGPVFSAGDVGKVYTILDTPVWIQLLMAVVGAAILLFIAYKMTKPFLEFSYKQEWIKDGNSRKNFSFRMIILPWIFGSAIMTVLYMPIIAVVSIIYPIMSGFVFIYPWQNAQRIEDARLSKNTEIGKFSIVSTLVLISLIIVFKLVLAPGIEL